MHPARKHYHAFLLRLWRTGKGKDSCWRASIESTTTGKRKSFSGLAELFAFLEKQTKDEAGHGENPLYPKRHPNDSPFEES